MGFFIHQNHVYIALLSFLEEVLLRRYSRTKKEELRDAVPLFYEQEFQNINFYDKKDINEYVLKMYNKKLNIIDEIRFKSNINLERNYYKRLKYELSSLELISDYPKISF